jgi:hypothetical protein
MPTPRKHAQKVVQLRAMADALAAQSEALRAMADALDPLVVRDGSVIHAIAAIPVGKSEIIPAITRVDRLTSYRRAQAAKLVGDAGATWAAKTTTKGVRITRTA